VSVSPPLTIGLPVYNGQNYVSESLDSLLAQTYSDFELIISDNASTDGTEDICRDYATRDSRIRYVRQPVNIGAAPNHNYLVQAARGRLFKWAAHDDLFAPKLVERCIEALDDRPELILAHAYMGIVDEQGKTLEIYDYRLATDSPRPSETISASRRALEWPFRRGSKLVQTPWMLPKLSPRPGCSRRQNITSGT
jgi:glycosyltransferase involved in cell wall biosynthesis